MGMNFSYRTRKIKDGCREGNIDEVYLYQCNVHDIPESEHNRFYDIEKLCEVNHLTANAMLIDIATEFMRAGGKVILISDMYFSSDQIMEIICDVCGDTRFFDSLYSSSDEIISKSSGKIFPELTHRRSLIPERTYHIGDSLNGDVRRPREAGWRSRHFPVSASEIRRREADLASFVREMDLTGINVRSWAKI